MSTLEVYCESNGVKSSYKGFQTKAEAIAFVRRFVKSIVDEAVLVEDTKRFDALDKGRYRVLYRNPDNARCWVDNI